MGITAYVYRCADGRDCTLLGWSSKFTRVCVINAEGPSDPDDDCPAVVMVRHRTMPALHVVSLKDQASGRWTMMGGNFLHSSDSRFGELCRRLMEEGGRYTLPTHMFFGAIPIHDRIEG